MAITTLLNNSPVNVATGVHDIGPVTVSDTVTFIDFRIKRCTTATPTFWPNATTTLKFDVLCSYDGGATWKLEASTGPDLVPGGIMPNGKGGEFQEVRVAPSLAPGTGRQVKMQATVANGPLVSQVTVTAE